MGLIYPLQNKFEYVRKFYKKMKRQMFFTEILIIIIEGYIEFLQHVVIETALREFDHGCMLEQLNSHIAG